MYPSKNGCVRAFGEGTGSWRRPLLMTAPSVSLVMIRYPVSQDLLTRQFGIVLRCSVCTRSADGGVHVLLTDCASLDDQRQLCPFSSVLQLCHQHRPTQPNQSLFKVLVEVNDHPLPVSWFGLTIPVCVETSWTTSFSTEISYCRSHCSSARRGY
jgi:hypothetical protein